MGRIIPWVNGRPITEIGTWEGVKYSHGAAYGPLRASWQMADRLRHHNLYWGASVVLVLGGVPIWRGFLNEPGRDGAMSALGLWEEGKGAQCLDASGANTAEPRDAVARAIARGVLHWSSPVPDFYPGAAAQQMPAPYPAQNVVTLLAKVAEEQGTRWLIDSYTGAPITRTDPTEPTWLVPALVAGEGLTPASDSVATHLVGIYLVSPGVFADPPPVVVSPDYVAGSPIVEQQVSLVHKGFITDTQARAYLTNMFGEGVGKVGWADGLKLGRGDVLTMGGQVLDPAMVIAGSMGRLAGVWDDRAPNPLASTDIVADETEYDEDADTVQVKPVGLERRTLKEQMTWLAR